MASAVIQVSPSGAIRISAFSLKNDSWEDFKVFLEQANSKESDVRARNRCLRAAHFNLYAHLEAVMYELGKKCLSKKQRKGKLYERVRLISESLNLEPLELLGRKPRNQITHPDQDAHIAFSDITFEALEQWSNEFSFWLDQACVNAQVERFDDTEKSIYELANPLGDLSEPIQEL